MAVTKHRQDDPRDQDGYEAYVAAAITGLLISDPKLANRLESLATKAHQVAEYVVFMQRIRDQIYDYSYTDLYSP